MSSIASTFAQWGDTFGVIFLGLYAAFAALLASSVCLLAPAAQLSFGSPPISPMILLGVEWLCSSFPVHTGAPQGSASAFLLLHRQGRQRFEERLKCQFHLGEGGRSEKASQEMWLKKDERVSIVCWRCARCWECETLSQQSKKVLHK